MKKKLFAGLAAGLFLLGMVGISSATTLINGGFEEPYVGGFGIIHQSIVPGWSTTASDGMIEIWGTGFNGVPSYEGRQHAELNANEVSTLFQDVAGIPADSIIGFQFAHRGRAGTDTLCLTITDLGSDETFGTGDDTVLFTKEYSTGNTGWALYTNAGESHIDTLGNTVRFAYESVAAAGGSPSIGNFLDAANFGIGVGVLLVPIDIKPQSCPNPLNIKSKGVLSVAIMGKDDFDLEEIDLTSLRLAEVVPIRSSMEDVGRPEDAEDCYDYGPDGWTDLTLKFNTQEIVGVIGDVNDGDEIVLTLTGNLKEEFGGTEIKGEDVVIILKKGKK